MQIVWKTLSSLRPFLVRVSCLESSYQAGLLDLKIGFPGGSDGKESACNAGEPGLIPELGIPLEKGMATHSSILAWREFHGQRTLVGYSPWCHKESEMTKRLILSHFHFHI